MSRLGAALLLALAASASAQPTIHSGPVGYRLPKAVQVLDDPGGATPNAYRSAMVTVVAGGGAALGATVPVLFVVFASSGYGLSEPQGPSDGALLALAGLGSVAGAGLAVYVFGQDAGAYRGILPYPDIRRDDAGPALLGAVAGLLPGVGLALLIQQALPDDADPLLTYLAVPVAQGIGAAIAIDLSR